MEKLKDKRPDESQVIMTEVVFPNDTNPLGILRGGRIMDWMDTASAICAQTHANKIAVTASVDRLVFNCPIKLGDIVTVKAIVTCAFTTSMEIYVEVWARRIPGERQPFLSNKAYFTFVALDSPESPGKIPGVIPVTDEEKLRYNQANERYKNRKS